VAGIHGLQEPLGLERGGEGEFDLGGGLLDRDDLGEPFAGDEVLDDQHRHPGCGEVGRVEDPDVVRGVLGPLGEGSLLRPSGAREWTKVQVSGVKYSPDGGRGDPHPGQVGAAVGEFAVGSVDLAPFLEQGQDLGCLIGQDPVHREPARRPVGQPAEGPAGVPAVGADLADLECPACPADTPPGVHGLVDEIQQPRLGGRIDSARDSAT